MESTLKSLLTTLGYPVYTLYVPANGTLPCYVYQKVSDSAFVRSHSGNEMNRARFQVSCWGKTYSEAITLADALETALDLNQTNFKLATKENELDDSEVESGLYRKIVDFYIYG